MSGQPKVLRGNTRPDRPDFADWLEPWCSGYNAAKGGLTDDDGEAFFMAAMKAWEQSGSERARRFCETGDPAEIPDGVGRW